MFVVIWEYIIRMMMEFLTYKLSHSLENKKKKKNKTTQDRLPLIQSATKIKL